MLLLLSGYEFVSRSQVIHESISNRFYAGTFEFRLSSEPFEYLCLKDRSYRTCSYNTPRKNFRQVFFESFFEFRKSKISTNYYGIIS